jgi:uncharacterized protein YeaO (DUF488 family)
MRGREMGRKRKILTKAELKKVKREFTKRLYQTWTHDEKDWANFYGPYREEVDAFVACCVGYVIGKTRERNL